MDKNRTILVGIIVTLVGVVFVGIFVLIALGRDVEQITTFALIVFPLVIAAAGLGANQVSQSQKLDTIRTQTNGTLSAEREENRRLVALLMEKHGVDVKEVTEIAPRSAARLEAPVSAGPQHRAEL